MDKSIADLRDAIATARSKEKLLRASLVSVNATLSTDELRNNVSLLRFDKDEILVRLVLLRSGNMKHVLPEEKENVEKEWKQWSKVASSRRRICMELWEYSTEKMKEGKTKGELWVSVAVVSTIVTFLMSVSAGRTRPRN